MIYITPPSATPPTAPFDDVETCRAWGRAKLPQALAAFRQATSARAPTPVRLDAACDVLRASVGCLAKMPNNNGVAELSMHSELICNQTLEDDGGFVTALHLGEGLGFLVHHTGEHVPDCALDDATGEALTGVIEGAIRRCIDADPDLLRAPFEALCDKLVNAFERAHPTDAITTIDELQALLCAVEDERRPQILLPGAYIFSRDGSPTAPPEGRAERDPETQIVDLEARLRAIEGHRRWDIARWDWLGRRLATLRDWTQPHEPAAPFVAPEAAHPASSPDGSLAQQ